MTTTTRVRGFLYTATATALTLTGTLAFAGPATADDTARLSDIENLLVHVWTTYSGYVLYPTSDGWEWSERVDVGASCTGWFASDEGHVATAGHCVEVDSSIRDAIIGQFLTDMDAEEYLDEALSSWTVEGYEDGSSIDRTVEVLQPNGADDPVITEWTVAQVVDFQTFQDGDAALLRVADTTGTTPLPVATDQVDVGDEIISIGYPGSVQDVVDVQRLAASFKTGTVSSRQVTDGGVPVIEINAQVSGGMSGGPTITTDGAVIGINSFGIHGESQSFNFVTDTENLATFLENNGVDPITASTGNDQPDSDTADSDVTTSTGTSTGPRDASAEDQAPRNEQSDGDGLAVVLFLALAGVGGLCAAGAAVVIVIVVVTRRRRPAPVQAVTTPAAAYTHPAPYNVPAAPAVPVTAPPAPAPVGFAAPLPRHEQRSPVEYQL